MMRMHLPVRGLPLLGVFYLCLIHGLLLHLAAGESKPSFDRGEREEPLVCEGKSVMLLGPGQQLSTELEKEAPPWLKEQYKLCGCAKQRYRLEA